MTVTASHIIDWRWHRQILIIAAFDGAQKGAEIGQVTELKK
jgi:hypothetical protein